MTAFSAGFGQFGGDKEARKAGVMRMQPFKEVKVVSSWWRVIKRFAFGKVSGFCPGFPMNSKGAKTRRRSRAPTEVGPYQNVLWVQTRARVIGRVISAVYSFNSHDKRVNQQGEESDEFKGYYVSLEVLDFEKTTKSAGRIRVSVQTG